MFDWNEITERLKKEVVRITFKKVSDGSVRVMECTLAEYLLPETSGKPRDNANPDVITVLDVDKGQWRAFRKDSVIDVEFPIDE